MRSKKVEKVVLLLAAGAAAVGLYSLANRMIGHSVTWPLGLNPKRVIGPYGASRGRHGERSHEGTDYAVLEGEDVQAPEAGIVRYAWNALGGIAVKLYADSGWVYYLAHLGSVEVPNGARVARADVIATSGASGNAASVVSQYGPSAAHLHLTVRTPQGELIDPERLTWIMPIA